MGLKDINEKWDFRVPKSSNGFVYVNDGSVCVYGEETKKEGTASEKAIAVAKLIACAPEMLEQLKKSRLDLILRGAIEGAPMIKEIDVLIKKATE